MKDIVNGDENGAGCNILAVTAIEDILVSALCIVWWFLHLK